MKINKNILLVILISIGLNTMAQVAINIDGSVPDESAILDLKSASKGLLPPRMTAADIGNIVNPASGLMVFNIDDEKVYVFVSNNNEWKELNYGTGTITPPWSCGYAFVDSRDMQSYETVQIGLQCWMAENLNTGEMIIGSIVNNQLNNQTNNGNIEKFCYDDDLANCNIYGGLYQWDEMMQYITTEGSQGICPTGWHIPSDAEWTELTDYLGGLSIAGGEMKEVGTTHWNSPNTDATNNSGFTALPAGARSYSSEPFVNLGYKNYLWTSSELDPMMAWLRWLRNTNGQVYRSASDMNKREGYSVRCIND